MNYEVGGISRTQEGWAETLGVHPEVIQRELDAGLTMQDVVHAHQIDTFAAVEPPQRGPGRPPLSTFTSGLIVPGVRKSLYSVTGDCPHCLSVLRDEYEVMHRAHLEGVEAMRRAEVKAGKQPEK